MGKLRIGLSEVENPTEWSDLVYGATTDQEGRFEFAGVLPGQYFLGINTLFEYSFDAPYPRVYYPGVPRPRQALPLNVALDESLENVVFQLPDFGPRRRIAIRVVDKDGMPVADALIRQEYSQDEETESGLPENLMTGPDGFVHFEGLRSATYRIRAGKRENPKIWSSEPMEIAPGEQDVSLVLRFGEAIEFPGLFPK